MKRPITTTLAMRRADRARDAATAMRSVESALRFITDAHRAARAAERESGAWVDHAARARLAAVLTDLRACRRELLRAARGGGR
jgi:hypothetical protein